MTTYPSSDESFARLHQSGWSVGDVLLVSPTGRFWLVSGTNGEHALAASGPTQAEAWHLACLQAEAVGMLRREERSVNEGPGTPGTCPAQ